MVSQTGQAPLSTSDVPHQALLIRSALNDDKDQVIANLNAGVLITVGSGGELWGTGKFQQFDPGWTEAGALWLENLLKQKPDFVTTPPVIKMDDPVRIAIAGDWGTGNWRTAANPAPSTDVARQIGFLAPDYTIHLGDTYYAGTPDQEKHLLTGLWPKGSLGALTLNSNHEMYSLAEGYYAEALAKPLFAAQEGCSYFALENANWVIVGLDSAYYASKETLYMDGSLFPPGGPQPQTGFPHGPGGQRQKCCGPVASWRSVTRRHHADHTLGSGRERLSERSAPIVLVLGPRTRRSDLYSTRRCKHSAPMLRAWRYPLGPGPDFTRKPKCRLV